MTDSNPIIGSQDAPHPAPVSDAGATAFIAVAPLYDRLMDGVPYDDWMIYLQRLLEERGAKPRRVLDLACGTGNMSERLAHEGYTVTGVDIAAGMIEEARRKADALRLDIKYRVQDAAELNLPGRRFDLCVSLFDSLNYVLVPERLALAFGRVAAHLTHNGLFIFDLNTEYALANHFFDQDNLSSDAPLRYEWVSDYFPDTRLCRVRMRFLFQEPGGEPHNFEEEHWQYAYRTDEIIEMLRDAGFDQITPYKAYTLRAPLPHSDRIFYVARRP